MTSSRPCRSSTYLELAFEAASVGEWSCGQRQSPARLSSSQDHAAAIAEQADKEGSPGARRGAFLCEGSLESGSPIFRDVSPPETCDRVAAIL